MAVIPGSAGNVSAWTNNSALISTGASPSAYTLNPVADVPDATPFNVSNMVKVAGLKSWSGTINTITSPARIGALSSVTFSGGYTTNALAWTVNFRSEVFDSTAFAPTGNWRTFVPGINSWDGTYECYLDDTTDIDANSNWLAGTAASATFNYNTTDTHTLAGTIIVSGYAISQSPTGLATVTVSFVGSGALTAASTTGDGLVADGALPIPTAGAITLVASGSQTFSGDAFPASFTIASRVDQVITNSINFQGTGALTPN